MKPEQFIREFGVEKAREVVEGAPGFPVFGYCTLTGNYIFKRSNATAYYHNETNSWSEDYAIELILLEDLKRLVESLDIIKDLGGMEKLTPYFITTDKHLGYTHVRMVGNGRLSFLDDFCDFIPDVSISIKRVMTAILDHESIYGGGENA